MKRSFVREKALGIGTGQSNSDSQGERGSDSWTNQAQAHFSAKTIRLVVGSADTFPKPALGQITRVSAFVQQNVPIVLNHAGNPNVTAVGDAGCCAALV